MIENWLGAELGVFFGVTLVLFGAASFQTGLALAETWRPVGQIFPYGLLMGVADRLTVALLFEQELLSLPAFAIAIAYLTAVMYGAYRITRARRMVLQYPWMYERRGLFSARIRRES
jgi:hypothetical protein